MAESYTGEETRKTMPANYSNEPTNEARACRAADVVQFYGDQHGTDPDAPCRDLLADLMHWADTYGVDFHDELRIATNHYNTEMGYYSSEVA